MPTWLFSTTLHVIRCTEEKQLKWVGREEGRPRFGSAAVWSLFISSSASAVKCYVLFFCFFFCLDLRSTKVQKL